MIIANASMTREQLRKAGASSQELNQLTQQVNDSSVQVQSFAEEEVRWDVGRQQYTEPGHFNYLRLTCCCLCSRKAAVIFLIRRSSCQGSVINL